MFVVSAAQYPQAMGTATVGIPSNPNYTSPSQGIQQPPLPQPMYVVGYPTPNSAQGGQALNPQQQGMMAHIMGQHQQPQYVFLAAPQNPTAPYMMAAQSHQQQQPWMMNMVAPVLQQQQQQTTPYFTSIPSAAQQPIPQQGSGNHPNNSNSTNNAPTHDGRSLRCYHCQSFGHKAIHCPSNPAWCGETSGQCTAHGKVRSLSALTRVGGTDQNPVYECIQSSRCQHYMRALKAQYQQVVTTAPLVPPPAVLTSSSTPSTGSVVTHPEIIPEDTVQECPTTKFILDGADE